jgi:hypothetical protein
VVTSTLPQPPDRKELWAVHRKGRQRHTEFQDLTTAEVSRLARDESLPTAVRRKYQKEEKCRMRRNRQKRPST